MASLVIVWVIFRFHIELEKKKAPWKLLPLVIPLYVYTRESIFDQIPAHRNLIGRGTIALSPCYRPAVVFHRLHLISLPFLHSWNSVAYEDLAISVLFFTFKNCIIKNLCNLNLRKPGSVRGVKCVVMFHMGVLQLSDQIQAVSSETVLGVEW